MECPNCGKRVTIKQNICRNCKLYLQGKSVPSLGNDFREVDISFIIKYMLGNAYKFLASIILLVIVIFLVFKSLSNF